MVRGVTFDFWQTIFYDPNEPQRMRVRAAGMADALAARGIHRPPATVLRAILDCGRHRLAIDQEREFAPFNQVTWILGRLGLAPDEMPPCLLAAVAAPYCEAGLTVPPVVFPAAPATLAELSQRYPLALICNTGASPGAVLRTVLFRAGLLGFFKACGAAAAGGAQAGITSGRFAPPRVVQRAWRPTRAGCRSAC